MRKTNKTRKWLLIALFVVVPTIGACGGGNVNVGYSPVTGCGSVDLDPGACDH